MRFIVRIEKFLINIFKGKIIFLIHRKGEGGLNFPEHKAIFLMIYVWNVRKYIPT